MQEVQCSSVPLVANSSPCYNSLRIDHLIFIKNMTKQNRMMVTVVVAWSQIRELFVWFQICLNMFIVRTMNLKYGEGVSGLPMIGDIAAVSRSISNYLK